MSIGSLLKRNAAISAVLLVLVMTVLDGTLVNVALPALARDFRISDSTSVWLVTVYQLVITMLLLPVSAIGDIFSYRRTFLTGVVIFTCASLLCALSPSFPFLVAARGIQGLGAACVMGVNIALTRIIYTPDSLGRGLALNAMVIAVATAAGPSIAGALFAVASWHWLFLINIPFGILAFIFGRRLLPQNPCRQHKKKFDLIACVQNAVTFGLILYALGNIARKGDVVNSAIILFVGLLVGFFYIRREQGREQPMLPVDLFKVRLYTLSVVTSVCSFISQNIAMVSLPFLYHVTCGFSMVTTGLLMTPWPVATMIVSPLAARFVEKHNPALTAAVGMAIYCLGALSLFLMPAANVSEWSVAWRMAVCGIGFGMYQTPNNIVMVMATPLHRSGAAGGMQSTARLLGQTVGATSVTIIFALISDITSSVHICLAAAIAFSSIASALSLGRVPAVGGRGKVRS